MSTSHVQSQAQGQAQTLTRSLAEALAQRRTALGLTQADLARQAGCTRQYVAQLERGERTRPSMTVASGLARGQGYRKVSRLSR